MDNAANRSVVYVRQTISDRQREVIVIVNVVILCGVVSMVGGIANAINLFVFYKQGLNTTINISFFSLAISDLCSLIFQQMYNLYYNPMFLGLDLPIVYSDLLFLTSALPREMFATITCHITAFITAERCLCVVFPLHVKQAITPKKTVTVIAMIDIANVIIKAPIYVTSYYTWKFYPKQNRTLLGLARSKYNSMTSAFVYISHGIFLLLGCLFVLTFTLILIYKLRQKNVWRQTANVGVEKATSMSRRDRATITLVVLVAGILVVCYTPAVLLGFATFIDSQFSRFGRHSNLYISSWSVALLLENINSSVNIFLYYKMSSKYRQTFIEMFCRRRSTDKKVCASED